MGLGVTTALGKEGSKPCLWHSLAISGMPEPHRGGSFGRSVNSIPTKGGRFCPPFTTGTPKFFNLPASLYIQQSKAEEVIRYDLQGCQMIVMNSWNQASTYVAN